MDQLNKSFKITNCEIDFYVVAKCQFVNKWKNVENFISRNGGELSLDTELITMYRAALNGNEMSIIKAKKATVIISKEK